MRRRRRAGGRQPAATPRQQQPEAEQEVVKQRQVLGRAAPGEALPLPLGWSAPGRQLQLRPVLPVGTSAEAGADEQKNEQTEGAEDQQQQDALQAAHDWSHGASDGRHTVKLDSLDDGTTRLICCPSLGTTALGASRSELEISDLWFSLSVDSDILTGGKQAKPLTGEQSGGSCAARQGIGGWQLFGADQ